MALTRKQKKAELPLNAKEISCVFTSRRVVASGQIFSGVRAKAVFGSMVLDLREAVIPEDCAIYFTAVMGSAEILVPAGVRLAVIGTPVLGEIKNESLLSTHACVPTLYLNATCVLGSIKVR